MRGHAAGSLRAEVAVANAMTTRSRLSASARGEDLVISGFALDSAEARVGYTAPNGRVAVALWQSRENDYALAGDFSLQGPRNELVAREVRLRFDTTLYRNPAPFAVRWGGTGGVEVDNLLLENQRGGRVYADGRLPIDGPANLGVAVTDFEIADALALTQSDIELTGLLTVEATVRGPASNPVFQGAAALATPRVDTTRAPNVRGTFGYANRLLTGQFEAVNDAGAVVATIDAEVPANLALTGVTGDRFPETGMRIDVAADSLPLGVVALATDVVSDVSGVATGRVALRGSFARPEIVGGLAIRDGSVTVTPLGIDVTGITGVVRMAGDTVVIDSLAGRSDGRLFVRGGLGIGNWREPSFDLYFVADDAKVLDNDQGELRASAGLALRGPFTSPYLSGQATVEEGVIFIPSGPQKRLISSGDPAVFAVLDTSVMSDRELLPGAEATLLRNLRADVDVVVNRNTWVRSREANIEIYTEEPISAHYENEAVALTGILSTERGEYELLSKRFEVSSGSALFIGLPEINPTIQLTAQYEVRLPSRPAINIQILVGGTLRAPRITLESDAQPPLSQTDLMSLVAFGTESSSLVAIAGSALTAEAGNAFSTGLAATRLAAVALGMAVEEVEMSALRRLGVDVFNIRPADVPFFRTTGSFEEFLLGTEFEIGKYVDPRTFVAVETVLPFSGAGVPPGVRVQHRRPGGYRYEAFYGPRFLLREPTLREQDRSPVAAVGSFGILLLREWRF